MHCFCHPHSLNMFQHTQINTHTELNERYMWAGAMPRGAVWKGLYIRPGWATPGSVSLSVGPSFTYSPVYSEGTTLITHRYSYFSGSASLSAHFNPDNEKLTWNSCHLFRCMNQWRMYTIQSLSTVVAKVTYKCNIMGRMAVMLTVSQMSLGCP